IAVLGLLVNLVSAWMLRDDHHHDDDDDDDDHDHGAHQDTNLRAAYLHVLADALTSVLAILGLIAGKFMGWIWMDAAAGLLGAAVIAHWSLGLVRSAGRTLLDSHDDGALEKQVRERLAALSGATISDLHLWRLGPGHYGLMLTLRGPNAGTPDEIRMRLAGIPRLSHVTVEINSA
ncbi:MAG: cation diffusion facilitator family transporter, partial [Steroidobacteraceae bacterium]